MTPRDREETDPMPQPHEDSPAPAGDAARAGSVPEQPGVQPTVSAVIPAYNAAETIERALDSVYAQTYGNIVEIIVVDDGSVDNTAQIVRDKYPGATLIQQENTGSSVARNRGVEAASGEYIAFLDDDDEWYPEKTAVQMQCFMGHKGIQFVLCEVVSDADNDCNEAADAGLGPPLMTPVTFRSYFLSADPLRFHGCSVWIARRSLLRAVGGFAIHMRRAQDSELLLRILHQGFSVVRLRRALVRYHSSATRRPAEEMARLRHKGYELFMPVLQYYAQRPDPAHPTWLRDGEADRKLGAFEATLGWSLWELGHRDEAREHLAEAARLSHGRGLRTLRQRLAAWRPGLYSALSRLRR